MNDVQYIAPMEAKAFFGRHGEFAVLDVREQEEFSRSHMLLASCAPLSRLELMAPDLVPCREASVILVDSGEERVSSRAERAFHVLAGMGYSKPMTLRGGMRAWLEKGYVEFTGVGALSKGFGECVEVKLGTPRLGPKEINAIMDSGEEYVIIDVRPCEEYNNMNIPGGINAPGCEAVYRFADLVPSDDATVIINCAGRTRSIIGTQTLCNAGIPNKVVALKGGTMNWQLAGYTLEYGTALRTAPPSPLALDIARKRAAKVAEKYGISFITAGKVREWQMEAGRKTLYVFDVRQPEEYAAGHIPGSRNAQGGQLVQAIDEYAAVRNARYVLADDTEVRAIMTAHWLKQMGLPDVHVLRGGLGGSGFGKIGLECGAASPTCPSPPEVRTIDAQSLRDKLVDPNSALVINVGVSSIHRNGHIPTAIWVTRGYLELARSAYPDAREIILTSDSDIHARLSAIDAAEFWPRASTFALSGGTPSWSAVGFPLEQGMPVALCAEDDVWYKPYTDINAKPEAMKGYFNWEFGLMERIIKDGDVVFSLL
jgi:rhodanese-related sulfurtransferase